MFLKRLHNFVKFIKLKTDIFSRIPLNSSAFDNSFWLKKIKEKTEKKKTEKKMV